MKQLFKVVFLAIGASVIGYFSYSAWYGKTLWESRDVQKNTEYTGKRIYTGYGNRLNHK